MSKEKKHGLAGKGFYMVLLLCAAAIGVSSYVVFRGDQEPLPQAVSAEPAVTAPTTVETAPAPDKSTFSQSTATRKPQSTTEAGAEVTTEAAAPVTWQRPVSGAVARAFSGDALVYCATLGDWRTHNGTDFACPVGTEVKAIGKGVVTEVSADGVTGMMVKVEHVGGYTAVYANLDANAMCKEGDEVAAGDVIGKVGRTMLSEVADQEHLHLEVMKNGQYIDPALLFPAE